MRPRFGKALGRWLLAALALACIVSVYRLWWHVNVTTVALTMLLYVLVLASRWPLRFALVAAVAATTCYNYYFLPPLNTFTINDPENWVALFALLTSAIIASRLSTRARNEAAEAKSSQREIEILFRLSSELLQTDSVASLLRSIPSVAVAVTGATDASLQLLGSEEVYTASQQGAATRTAPRSEQSKSLTIEVRSGVRTKGTLMLHGASLMPATADAVGKLVAVSLDRAQALERAAREAAARESERMRSWMIDSVTHELRTPLTSIKGAATALLAAGAGSESSRELLSIIDEESDRLNRLVSEAVEVASLDAREVQLRPRKVRLRGLTEAVLEGCAWVCAGHHVTLDMEDDLSAWADPHMLGRVLTNLLENAGKYSPAGTAITLSACAQEDRTVLLEVADRGQGVLPGEEELIFERFYRGAAAKAGAPGTGMGLAISRAIVLAHGGTLAVRRREGGGSIFRLTLPAEAPSQRRRR